MLINEYCVKIHNEGKHLPFLSVRVFLFSATSHTQLEFSGFFDEIVRLAYYWAKDLCKYLK